jgi:hypothetical protein
MKRSVILAAVVAALFMLGGGSALAAGDHGGSAPPACPPSSPNHDNPQDCGHGTAPCTDTDGDGVCDADDQCPNDAGPASNNGCPVPECNENGLDALADVAPGVASGVVHESVEPAVGGIDPSLQAAVHGLNCDVVVAVEDAVDAALAGG